MKVESIADTINANADVKALKQLFADAFEGFEDMLHEHLITNVMSVNEMKEQDVITEEIFRRLQPIALVDKYTAYQALADNWQTIVNDIETIQSDGIDAVRAVEQAYKIKKDGDNEIEVPDGIKGRILPFELVQSVKFQSELATIAQLQIDVDECASNLEDEPNNFTEDEALVYLEEGESLKLNKKKITNDAKAKSDYVDPETKAKLKEIVALWEKQSKINKAIKVAKTQLEEKTIETIQNLTDDEVKELLRLKWISPICNGINNVLSTELTELNKKLQTLNSKYTNSYKDINNQISEIQQDLSDFVGSLSGDTYAVLGMQEFMNIIKG